MMLKLKITTDDLANPLKMKAVRVGVRNITFQLVQGHTTCNGWAVAEAMTLKSPHFSLHSQYNTY